MLFGLPSSDTSTRSLPWSSDFFFVSSMALLVIVSSFCGALLQMPSMLPRVLSDSNKKCYLSGNGFHGERPLRIGFSTAALARTFSEFDQLRRAFGDEMAYKLANRMAVLDAADTL